MRIIAGKNRGKKLAISTDEKIRPTTDRAKEVMFNVLSHHYGKNLAGNILDACAGSGSLGIESLSRGASYVLFLDYYSVAIDLLNKNLSTLPYVLKKDYDVILADSSTFNFPKMNKIFDLVFLDAPYNSDEVSKVVANLLKTKVVDAHSILVIETNKQLNIAQLQILQSKQIGKTMLFFCVLAVDS
jgi:16S rRNA (guanine966-N2)-methyltransferase